MRFNLIAHTMIGAFSYMRYSYHGDFMVPTDGKFFCLGPAVTCVVNATGYYHTWISVQE